MATKKSTSTSKTKTAKNPSVPKSPARTKKSTPLAKKSSKSPVPVKHSPFHLAFGALLLIVALIIVAALFAGLTLQLCKPN